MCNVERFPERIGTDMLPDLLDTRVIVLYVCHRVPRS